MVHLAIRHSEADDPRIPSYLGNLADINFINNQYDLLHKELVDELRKVHYPWPNREKVIAEAAQSIMRAVAILHRLQFQESELRTFIYDWIGTHARLLKVLVGVDNSHRRNQPELLAPDDTLLYTIFDERSHKRKHELVCELIGIYFPPQFENAMFWRDESRFADINHR